jgi:Family of unknown function (DUF6510)
MQIEAMRLDGNAAGGMLRDVFSHEMTAAQATCAGCGRSSAIGALMNYGGSMGVILRCPVCDTAMLRVVGSPGWIRVDASRTTLLAIPLERPSPTR